MRGVVCLVCCGVYRWICGELCGWFCWEVCRFWWCCLFVRNVGFRFWVVFDFLGRRVWGRVVVWCVWWGWIERGILWCVFWLWNLVVVCCSVWWWFCWELRVSWWVWKMWWLLWSFCGYCDVRWWMWVLDLFWVWSWWWVGCVFYVVGWKGGVVWVWLGLSRCSVCDGWFGFFVWELVVLNGVCGGGIDGDFCGVGGGFGMFL